MAKRSKRSQSKHDTEVRRLANQYKRQGYDVKAEIRGFPKPGTIGGYRPDVVAMKGRQRRIVEVETTESVSSVRGEGQQRAFRKAANRSQNTTFKRSVVKTRR